MIRFTYKSPMLIAVAFPIELQCKISIEASGITKSDVDGYSCLMLLLSLS